MTLRPAMMVLTVSLLLILTGVLLAVWCMNMPGRSLDADLPPLSQEQQALVKRLSDHVHVLAGEIGERHYERMDELNRAADYIEEQFRAMGHVPAIYRFGEEPYRNIVVEIHGREKRDEIIVVGAHYDTTWRTPGADDNASGVAGLLEIARELQGQRFSRSIRLIAFANEEEPLYGTENMGSRVSARWARDRGEDIAVMFSLEMIGYYSSEAGSQGYPDLIRPFYPQRGNFIAFVSNVYSSPAMRHAVGRFRAQKVFPSEGMAAPEWLVPDIRRSDHAAYWRFGYPAVMITDTANYRNGNYHNPGDIPGSLDYDGMARVVSGLTDMLRSLADE